MGAVLQRKKRRSGRPKAVRKPKSKKRILSNPIIAANWNHTETLSQNYSRLGLTSKLNRTAGGVENKRAINNFIINPSKNPIHNAVHEAQVTIDPVTGAITAITEDFSLNNNPLNDSLAGIVDDDSEEAAMDDDSDQVIITQHNFLRKTRTAPAGSVVAQLEEVASNGVAKRPRQQSDQEQEWCAALVSKYGDDYQKMFWDRKLNPMQQTVGDLKRRLTKYKKAQKSIVV